MNNRDVSWLILFLVLGLMAISQSCYFASISLRLNELLEVHTVEAPGGEDN